MFLGFVPNLLAFAESSEIEMALKHGNIYTLSVGHAWNFFNNSLFSVVVLLLAVRGEDSSRSLSSNQASSEHEGSKLSMSLPLLCIAALDFLLPGSSLL